MLKVIDISFNDQEMGWAPEDPFDFSEWVTVTIGENGAGNYYQIHLCSPTSISRIEEKRHIFMLNEWLGLEDVAKKIDEFVEAKLNENVKDDPYEHLSKYWYWEYGGYSS